MYRIFTTDTNKATGPVRSRADRAGDFLGFLLAAAIVGAIILGFQPFN